MELVYFGKMMLMWKLIANSFFSYICAIISLGTIWDPWLLCYGHCLSHFEIKKNFGAEVLLILKIFLVIGSAFNDIVADDEKMGGRCF